SLLAAVFSKQGLSTGVPNPALQRPRTRHPPQNGRRLGPHLLPHGEGATVSMVGLVKKREPRQSRMALLAQRTVTDVALSARLLCPPVRRALPRPRPGRRALSPPQTSSQRPPSRRTRLR